MLGYLWNTVFPINKALWTSSYAVLTAGLALLAFAACYWAIEIVGLARWAAPFAALGVNALALYVLSSLAAVALLVVRVADGQSLHAVVFERVFAPWLPPADASLAYAAAYLLVWWLVMAGLARTGLRLRA